MLTRAQVEQFHRDGFLNAGRMLDDGQLAELSSDLDRVIARGPDGFAEDEPRPVSFRDLNAKGDGVTATPVWQIVNIWEAAGSFERLVYHPAIVTGISQLTGFGDLQVWHDQVQYKPAAIGGATGWHQDAPAWPTLEPMTQVSAWIPFDDAGLDNGCMWMVPGSWRWGNQHEYFASRPQQERPRTLEEFVRIGDDFTPPGVSRPAELKVQPCPVRRGEVHFHHAPHLARLAAECLAAPAPCGGDPLHDRSGPLHRPRTAPDGALPGPAAGGTHGGSGAALPDRLPPRGGARQYSSPGAFLRSPGGGSSPGMARGTAACSVRYRTPVVASRSWQIRSRSPAGGHW